MYITLTWYPDVCRQSSSSWPTVSFFAASDHNKKIIIDLSIQSITRDAFNVETYGSTSEVVID